MDPHSFENHNTCPQVVGDRRQLLTGVGGGFALAVSGLLLPADLDARHGGRHKRGKIHKRRSDRRHKRRRRRHNRDGRGLLRNIDLDVTGNASFWVRPGTDYASQFTPKITGQIGGVTQYETIKVHLNDDEGYVLVQQGVIEQAPVGFVIYMNNPLVGRPQWAYWQDATFTRFGVSGTQIQKPDTIYPGNGGYHLTAGNLNMVFVRNDDTATINFALRVSTD